MEPKPTIRDIAFAAALVAFLIALAYIFPGSKQDSAIASCYTDHPVNVVQCVDTGTGNHSLMEAMPHR